MVIDTIVIVHSDKYTDVEFEYANMAAPSGLKNSSTQEVEGSNFE